MGMNEMYDRMHLNNINVLREAREAKLEAERLKTPEGQWEEMRRIDELNRQHNVQADWKAGRLRALASKAERERQ